MPLKNNGILLAEDPVETTYTKKITRKENHIKRICQMWRFALG
jgi:hypothetical protein